MTLRISGLIFSLLIAGPAAAQSPLLVTSAADSGEGTLREALAIVDKQTILIAVDGPIIIDSPLIYEGTEALRITGVGQTIQSSQNIDILVTHNTDFLTLTGIGLRGPSNFNMANRNKNTAGRGLFVSAPFGSKDQLTVRLSDVNIHGVAGHGIHITDCNDATGCNDSMAESSVVLILSNTHVFDAGHGRHDADGIRMDEHGKGDIFFYASDSSVIDNGGDGIELDEAGKGDVNAQLTSTYVGSNGFYCDPAVIAPLLPKDGASFAAGEMMNFDLTRAIDALPDPNCIDDDIDKHTDRSIAAFDYDIDIEDGLDIDETGPGAISVNLQNTDLDQNASEGLDFDEEDAGSLRLTATDLGVVEQGTEGIKLTEEGPGDLLVTVQSGIIKDSVENAFIAEEDNHGDLRIVILDTEIAGNGAGEDTGIEAAEDGRGNGEILLLNSDITDGLDLDGVTLKR